MTNTKVPLGLMCFTAIKEACAEASGHNPPPLASRRSSAMSSRSRSSVAASNLISSSSLKLIIAINKGSSSFAKPSISSFLTTLMILFNMGFMLFVTSKAITPSTSTSPKSIFVLTLLIWPS